MSEYDMYTVFAIVRFYNGDPKTWEALTDQERTAKRELAKALYFAEMYGFAAGAGLVTGAGWTKDNLWLLRRAQLHIWVCLLGGCRADPLDTRRSLCKDSIAAITANVSIAAIAAGQTG